MSKEQFVVTWEDSGRWPKELPDLRYPEGIDLDVARGKKPSCTVMLPYPAKRCGTYFIECKKCGLVVAATTAGRIDDPRSITLPCKTK